MLSGGFHFRDPFSGHKLLVSRAHRAKPVSLGDRGKGLMWSAQVRHRSRSNLTVWSMPLEAGVSDATNRRALPNHGSAHSFVRSGLRLLSCRLLHRFISLLGEWILR
jgi:hypothetical protein